MSCFFMVGFFALADGQRIVTNRLSSKSKIWHRHYSTTIQCSNGLLLPANLRVYSPMNDPGFPDQTVVFATVKAFTPVGDTVQLDAQYIAPFPGDPADNDYQDSIPDIPHTFAFAVGHVPKKFELMPDGKSKGFMVVLSECVYDGSSTRWNNTPTPNPQSCIHIFGTCHSITPSGHLSIRLDAISLNLSAQVIAPLGQSPSTPVSNKRRKYQTHTSPNTMQTTSHTTPLGSPSIQTSPSPFSTPAFESSSNAIAGPSTYNRVTMPSMSSSQMPDHVPSHLISSCVSSPTISPMPEIPTRPTEGFQNFQEADSPLTPILEAIPMDHEDSPVPSDFGTLQQSADATRRKSERKKGKERAL